MYNKFNIKKLYANQIKRQLIIKKNIKKIELLNTIHSFNQI